MKKTSLAELESRFGRREAVVVPWLLGAIAGLAVPVITLVVGWMIELLIRASVASSLPEWIELGPHLAISTVWLDATNGPLRGVLSLMALGFGLAVVEAVLLLALYRWAIHYAIDFEIWLRRTFYDKNLASASQYSFVGQKAAQTEATTFWIPQVRDGILAWYRSGPRHFVQALACFSLAVLIHPTLMLLAVIAFVLLWKLYSMIDRRRRRLRPVLTERSQIAQSRLLSMSESGLHVSTAHASNVNRESFESQLRSYRDVEIKIYDSFIWKTPLLLVMVAGMLSVFCLALSVRILQTDATLGVSGSLAMLVLVGFGYVSVLKVMRTLNRIVNAESAALQLLDALNQALPVATSIPTQPATPLQHELLVESVTLKDTLGQKLLEDISFQARPGMLIALVATTGLEAKTLGELLLGFGVPSTGRIVWDSKATSELNAMSLQQLNIWVTPDGPMTSGTLIENLSFGDTPLPTSEVVDAIRLSGAYDAVTELSDTFLTIISAHDDRLKNDTLYQLGIARALLRRPSIVVAEEPSDRVTATIESQSVTALRQLTQRGSLVFVLPQRLHSLRSADLVILLHEHHVAGIGSHIELLANSELYRHLNYVRFTTLGERTK